MNASNTIFDIANLVYHRKLRIEREINYALASCYWQIGERINHAKKRVPASDWSGVLEQFCNLIEINCGALLTTIHLLEGQKLNSVFPLVEKIDTALFVIPWPLLVKTARIRNEDARYLEYLLLYKFGLEQFTQPNAPKSKLKIIGRRPPRSGNWFPEDDTFPIQLNAENLQQLKTLTHASPLLQRKMSRINGLSVAERVLYQSTLALLEFFSLEVNAVIDGQFQKIEQEIGTIILADHVKPLPHYCKEVSRELEEVYNLKISIKNLIEYARDQKNPRKVTAQQGQYNEALDIFANLEMVHLLEAETYHQAALLH